MNQRNVMNFHFPRFYGSVYKIYAKAHLFSLIIYAYDHKILQCCCLIISEVHSLALDVLEIS